MSKKYICNPLVINYHYQFNKDQRRGGALEINREAADPSMILFKGRYYIFASMNLSVWVSDDLVNWESYPLPDDLPLYDYAPDVRVIGDYVYFCASAREHNCDRFRTKDILNGPYEKLPGTFPFWDPNVFVDDDGRIYFYWGCTNTDPIWGVELDPETMLPIGEKVGLLAGDPWHKGYERCGEDHCTPPATEEEVEAKYQAFVKNGPMPEDKIPDAYKKMIRGMFTNMPFIEGPWMDKKDGVYYLQYAFPGTQYNIYGDGVYVSDSPLGPFKPARNNPYSYKPGGFLPGAGHGSSMEDKAGNWWHTATGRISMNHSFERRVGLWPAGFDKDGDLFCNQRYGDWPLLVTGEAQDPWREPAWYLLSVGKAAAASSAQEGHEASRATEENVQTWWRPETKDRGEWLCVDLGEVMDVHAVQVNFGDDHIDIPVPGEFGGESTQARYIDVEVHETQWKLLGSSDGENWFVIEDKSEAKTDLSHDLVVCEEGLSVRYLKLTDLKVPYDQIPCVSGLRVFGFGNISAPGVPSFSVERTSPLDMKVVCADPGAKTPDRALGFNVLWGYAPDKLYHSYMIFKNEVSVGALIDGESYYVRVDAFNENGITEGDVIKVE